MAPKMPAILRLYSEFRAAGSMASSTLPESAKYAIKSLTCLALCTGRPMPAGKVAQCVGIPPSQAAKILHFLKCAGFTRSLRGASGGYLLGQCPEEIRLERVVKLFQPSHEEDSVTAVDPLEQIWSEIYARSQWDWEQLTIADLARGTADQWKCSACTKQEAQGSND